MDLIFDRGTRESPLGHALIYFTAEDGKPLATYVSVPPIPFDISKFVPNFMASMVQGMGDLNDSMLATPMPPVPEEVESIEYLRALAERRQDDLIYAGGAMRADPFRLAAETSEAVRLYGDLYRAAPTPTQASVPPARVEDSEMARFAEMGEGAQLNQLTALTGRLRDSIDNGGPDQDVEREIEGLASMMPAKYRARDLVEAAHIPGERGQRLAQLYLERCYKLFNEEYLDLERIDREIEAMRE